MVCFLILAISPDGLLCQCREQRAWEGCRSSHGVGAGEFNISHCFYAVVYNAMHASHTHTRIHTHMHTRKHTRRNEQMNTT